jgi:tetratricopeptide (TPR) repeat protein
MSSTYVVGDQPVPGAGYRLASFLGRGGFGEVWKATAPGGAEAAIKIIRLGSREGSKELRALQLVKRIHHTHLVPIIAFWIKNDKGEMLDDAAVMHTEQPKAVSHVTAAPDSFLGPSAPTAAFDRPSELIIAMGLGERNLYDRLEQCRGEGLPGIPDEELLGYMEDSAEAIDFLNRPMHDLGSGPVAIQHCDIKPHNLVMVGGSVQVCDFGLARMMGADRATTAAASVAYAAPECLVEGKPSATTDQYCLAVTFIELKTGQLPYSDLTMAAVLDAKRNEKLDYSLLPEAVRPIVRRATSADPAKRFASCCEMVCELRRALDEAPAAAPRVSGKRGRRMFVATLAVAALAGGGVWAWQNFPLPAGLFPGPGQPDVKQAELTSVGKPSGEIAVKPIDSSIAIPPAANRTDLSKQEGEAALAKGIEALNGKQFDDAAIQLQRASELLPQDARVFSSLGAARLGQKRWNEAIESYNKAIETRPTDRDYLGRGQAYLELKEDEKAKADFAAAVNLNSGNVEAHDALGESYLASGKEALDGQKYDAALAELQKAGTHKPNDARVFSRLGAAWMGKENWKEAASAYTRALDIGENDDDYVNRGWANMQLKATDKAIEDFKAAVKQNPANAKAYVALAGAYLDKDNDKLALENYSKAIAIETDNPKANFPLLNARILRANAYLATDKKAEAANDLTCAGELASSATPKDIESLLATMKALMEAYAEAGQFDEAVKWAENSVTLAPDEKSKEPFRKSLKEHQTKQAARSKRKSP